jgi:hypothetical protein
VGVGDRELKDASCATSGLAGANSLDSLGGSTSGAHSALGEVADGLAVDFD